MPISETPILSGARRDFRIEPGGDPGDVTKLRGSDPSSRPFPQFTFQTPDGDMISASGMAARFISSGPDRFRRAGTWLSEIARSARYEGDMTPQSLYAVGLFGFDGEACEEWGEPGSVVFIPERVEHLDASGRAWEVIWRPDEGPVDLERAHTERSLDRVAKAWSHVEWSRSDWRRAVEAVLRRIERGDLEKVVLARSRVQSDVRADAFDSVGEVYPGCYRFRHAARRGMELFGASPERLVSLRSGRIQADAVAGTAYAGDPDDPSTGAALLRDPKEREEHEIVAREVLSALLTIAPDAIADPEPKVERHRRMLHLRTRLQATAPAGLHLLDLVARIHPSPAVAGSPRQAALELIRTWEPRPRGWYAGPIGWMNAAGEGEFTLGLRCALLRGGDALLYAGAGIVAGSDPDREWEECEAKLSFLGDLLAHG
jgi:menaquinone-specific isochorismate synthase